MHTYQGKLQTTPCLCLLATYRSKSSRNRVSAVQRLAVKRETERDNENEREREREGEERRGEGSYTSTELRAELLLNTCVSASVT